MMKMRLVLFFGMLAVLCLTVKAEDPQAEPESAAEPSAEPESHDHDAKHSGSSKSETKAAKNTGIASWTFPSIPAILALTAIAKFVL